MSNFLIKFHEEILNYMSGTRAGAIKSLPIKAKTDLFAVKISVITIYEKSLLKAGLLRDKMVVYDSGRLLRKDIIKR